MADHALNIQLPSMVRKPKAVWPGLVRMGMYQKQIAGDGNCLFASLSDQLYGTPARHSEIRAKVIEHMRNFRPLFEHYVHKDDVQQRRRLRSATAAPRQEPEDAFEEYISLMSRSGTYGGEPELVAFCQVYDQDVIVHLPRIKNFNRDSISYRNEHREIATPALPLHICYGGDEVTRAHYDSARSRDGSIPRSLNSPLLKAVDFSHDTPTGSLSPNPDQLLSTRAIRNSRSDLSTEVIQDLILKSRREVENNADQLGDKFRARSPSVTSSQRSSSSKRSLDDDGEPIRSSKRADRRKSTRRRADMAIIAADMDNEPSPGLPVDSSNPHSPPSTQETDQFSDTPSTGYDHDSTKSISVPPGDKNSSTDTATSPTQPSYNSQSRPSISIVASRPPQQPSSPRLISVAERPKSSLRA